MGRRHPPDHTPRETHRKHAAPRVSADAVAAPPEPRPARPRPAHLYRTAALLFLLALVYRFFTVLAHVFLLGYAAAILAVGLNALGRRLPLERRWLAALVGVLTVAGLALVLWLGTPVLIEQARGLGALLPDVQQRLREWEEWIRARTGLRVQIPTPGEGEGGGLPSGMAASLFGGMTAVLRGALFTFVVFFGALFAMAKPNERLTTPLLRAFPDHLRLAWYRIFQLLGERIVGWLKGTAMAMLGVGILSVIAFTLIGVPNALLLGIVNGLVEFIPILGPWIGGGLAALFALVVDPTKALWTVLAAVVIQQIESNVITPFAMSKNAQIHPFITLFALVLFGELFGFLGLLLALPLVLLVWTVVQVLWVERAIDTDTEEVPPLVEE